MKKSTLLALGLLVALGLYGQKTSPYVETNSLVVNNSGFNNVAIRTVALARPTPMHLNTGAINATFPLRFVVAKADLAGGTKSWAGANDLIPSANNISTGGVVALVPTGCNAYFEVGAPVGQWRLPTQREMILIAMVKLELLGSSGQSFSALTGSYWTATQQSATQGWSHAFSYSVMYPRPKTDQYQVRCVRDL